MSYTEFFDLAKLKGIEKIQITEEENIIKINLK